MPKSRNRLAQSLSRERDEPLEPEEPEKDSYIKVMVPPDDIPLVMRCPRCGAARCNGWEHCSGGKGEPYKRCRACGSKFRIASDGRMILIG